MKPLLTLKNISFSYNNIPDNKTDVLNNINLTINPCEIVSITGPAGCGKSTLLAIICGLIIPEQGCMTIDGSHIGHMLSRGNLFEWITTYRNIYNCYTKSNVRVSHQSNSYPAIDFFRHDRYSENHNQCPDCKKKNCLKRRAELIKTLSFEPDLLLLDEPFLPFDAEGKLSLAYEIRNMLIKEQKTAILATNDLDEAILFSDKIILLTDKPAYISRQIDVPASMHTIICQENNPVQDFKTLMASSEYIKLTGQIRNNGLTAI